MIHIYMTGFDNTPARLPRTIINISFYILFNTFNLEKGNSCLPAICHNSVVIYSLSVDKLFIS